MKTFILTALLTVTAATANAEIIKVDVNGLVCAFCATAIEKTFKKVEGVNSVKVDLDKRLVTIDAADGNAPSDKLVKKSIEDAGYNVVKISREE